MSLETGQILQDIGLSATISQLWGQNRLSGGYSSKTIEGDAAEADALVSSAWDHKNIALLEPTSTCGADEQNDQAWGISVFKVKEHRHCSDGETAWEGHPCVHYSGYVSAATSNFVNVNEGRFVCQLFVDSTCDELHDLYELVSSCYRGE